MWLFIGLVVAAIAIIMSVGNLKASRAIGLDRGAMFKVQSNVVICPNCQTRMKRQLNGQQCPKCYKSF